MACQDALVHELKSVSLWCQAARDQGVAESSLDLMKCANFWTLEATFSTLTNVNFSEQCIIEYIWEGEALKQELKAIIKTAPKNPIAHTDLMHTTVQQIEHFAKAYLCPSTPKK